MKKKVAVAMSGGVDSGVAAGILVRKRYKCVGFHMRLWHESASSEKRLASSFENKCCSTESLDAARKTAFKLGIPFYSLDFTDIFKKKVVDYFLAGYAAGLTPNPCVMCNKFIKFGELLDYVRRLGYDYLATGHYTKVTRKNVSRTNVLPVTYHLLQAKDKSKDQSYFLYNLTQPRLAHILFPIGDYTKKEVRQLAKKWLLPVAERPESQEICFFPESDYRPFLTRQIPQKIIPGDVVDTERRVIGKHKGMPLYTIGQRHGFRIADKRVIGPLYVIDKDIKKNQLVVGFGKEGERKEFWVKEVNWLGPRSLSEVGIRCFVRIRHQGELLKCKIKNEKGKIKVVLEEPERGIAPGQAGVFYEKEEVLGGGIMGIDKR